MKADKNIWTDDADNLKLATTNVAKYVHINDYISPFLDYEKKCCITGTKGMGKTLLLKAKRLKIMEEHPPEVIIPKKYELDSINISNKTCKKIANLFDDVEQWKDLWCCAISLSVVMNNAIARLDKHYVDRMRKEIISIGIELNQIGSIIDDIDDVVRKIDAKTVVANDAIIFNVSSIITSFLTAKNSIIESFVLNASPILKKYYSYAESDTAVFIDKVDQRLDSTIRKLWFIIQHGLLEAVFELNQLNKNVSIYFSVREEAWATFGSQHKKQMNDYVVKAIYDIDDLKMILRNAICNYENNDTLIHPSKINSDPIGAYFGVNKILNKHTGDTELITDYIYRHSFARPRDIIYYGAKFHGIKNKINEDYIIASINRLAAEDVRDCYLDEMKFFMDAIDDDNVDIVLSEINKNILTYEELKKICSKLNNNSDLCSKFVDCSHCDPGMHFFCDLYQIGLIGVIATNVGLKKKIQQFLTPNDMSRVKIRKNALPKSKYYLIHPALQDYIGEVEGSYSVVRGVLVGDKCEWKDVYDSFVDINTLKENIKKMNSLTENTRDKLYDIVLDLDKILDSYLDPREKSTVEVLTRKIKLNIKSDGLKDASSFCSNIISILDKIMKYYPGEHFPT